MVEAAKVLAERDFSKGFFLGLLLFVGFWVGFKWVFGNFWGDVKEECFFLGSFGFYRTFPGFLGALMFANFG